MQSAPKIMVIQLKEILSAILFIFLAIILILFLIFMFLPDKKSDSVQDESNTYHSGTYTASLVLNSVPVEVAVCVDDNYIKSVELVSLKESVSAMYPLLQPSIEDIEQFLVANQSLEDMFFDTDNTYTGTVLLQAINTALKKAEY